MKGLGRLFLIAPPALTFYNVMLLIGSQIGIHFLKAKTVGHQQEISCGGCRETHEFLPRFPHNGTNTATKRCYDEAVSADATAVFYCTGPHAEPEGL